MENVKVKITDPHVTGPAGNLNVGQEIELDPMSAKALVAEGKATPVVAEVQKAPLNPTGGANDKLPGTGDDGAAKEALKKMATDIDAKYKGDKPGLEAAAKNLEVEFKFEATRAEIIAAVIAAGKGEAILALTNE